MHSCEVFVGRHSNWIFFFLLPLHPRSYSCSSPVRRACRSKMYGSKKKKKKKRQKQKQKMREQSWGVDVNAKLPKYNALTDPNLRHHFESRKIQSHLLKSGLIDHQGRVVDVDAAKSKLAVIEREFRNAEKSEFQRMRDEAEMRRRVQKKRHEALEISRRQEMIAKVHEDRKIRRAILKIQKDQVYTPPPLSSKKKAKPKVRSSDRLPPVKVDFVCIVTAAWTYFDFCFVSTFLSPAASTIRTHRRGSFSELFWRRWRALLFYDSSRMICHIRIALKVKKKKKKIDSVVDN